MIKNRFKRNAVSQLQSERINNVAQTAPAVSSSAKPYRIKISSRMRRCTMPNMTKKAEGL
ncbi:MAG TPA: hypothetical protein DHU16_00815 [Gammaproteobacteria bacterium]|nr:hypothetical protein [Gammaproteobacteria bacterium]